MEDEKIIQLYIERIESAITETRLKYGKMCVSIAYGILRSMEDAEECENDTYLKTWNAIPPARPAAFAAFIGKIVRNLSLDRYEFLHAQKRGNGEIPVILDELAECIPDEKSGERMTDTILRELLNDFLQSLSKDARVIFMRRYWFSDPISEIAQRYGYTESKVKMSLARSRKSLETVLKKEGYL